MALFQGNHPRPRRLGVHAGAGRLYRSRNARAPHRAAGQGRVEVRPGELRLILRPVQSAAGRQGTRTATRSQAHNFVVSLLDALNMVLPTTLLLAMIAATAWMESWI